MASGPSIVAVVAWKPFPSNLPLVEAWRRLGIAAELLGRPTRVGALGPATSHCRVSM